MPNHNRKRPRIPASDDMPPWMGLLAYLAFLLAIVAIVYIVATLAPQIAPYLRGLF